MRRGRCDGDAAMGRRDAGVGARRGRGNAGGVGGVGGALSILLDIAYGLITVSSDQERQTRPNAVSAGLCRARCRWPA